MPSGPFSIVKLTRVPGLIAAEIDRRCDRKLHGHRRPADLGDGLVADIDLVLCGIDGIDRAGAVRIVVALMRHLHLAVLRCMRLVPPARWRGR